MGVYGVWGLVIRSYCSNIQMGKNMEKLGFNRIYSCYDQGFRSRLNLLVRVVLAQFLATKSMTGGKIRL